MIEAKVAIPKNHPEIIKAQEKFQEVYSRYSEGVGLVTAQDFYQVILEVNQAKIDYGDLNEEERKVREFEIERITLLLEEKDIK